MLSTYLISFSNFCSQLMALRPLTCANPVSPGLTSCRLDSRLLYNGRYSTKRGRGPTIAISPTKIFKSCGNSSRDVFRSTFPYPLSRCSSGSKVPALSFLLLIVLNLIIRKIFSFPDLSFFPGRNCTKKGFPRIATAPTAVKTKKIGDNITSAKSESTKSKNRFQNFAYIPYVSLTNQSKHARMTEMIFSCWAAVILLSLGRQQPRPKMSAPTSGTPPAI